MLLSILLLALTPVHAEDAPPPSTPATPPLQADAKEQAKAHGDAGTRFYNVQQYDKAAEEYQQAYLLDPQLGYLYATAQAQRLGGNCANAIKSYQAFARGNPPDRERVKAEHNIERCQQELRDRPPTVEAAPSAQLPAVPPPPAEALPAPPLATPPPAAPPLSPRRWPGYALAGGGVVAAAVGTYLYLSGRGTIADNNGATTYADWIAGRTEVDGARAKQAIGVSAMAVGGGLVLGGVLYLVLGSGDVSAAVSSEQATVAITRTF